MGQKPSGLGGSFRGSKWFTAVQRNPNPEQPIKFQYKTKRKHSKIKKALENDYTLTINQSDVHKRNNIKEERRLITSNRTKSEPNLTQEKREKHRHRRRTWRVKDIEKSERFGYEIQDVDCFLTKATLEKPANIPVVLAFPSILYQTRLGGYQAEISLPLGMVVNAVFKNQHWLYVQTPHAQEGYVSYAACLPLGIIPPAEDDSMPCWEKSTDVFPKPSGNMTDTEKLSSKSDCGPSPRCRVRSRNAVSSCGERSVDRLYLRAAASAKARGIRQTLLIVTTDYEAKASNALNVKKDDVVSLLDANVKGWFYVRNKEGEEGYIPAAIAGHGFL